MPRAIHLALTAVLFAGAGCELSDAPPPAPALTPKQIDQRGDEHLLAGRFEQAVRDFDAFLKTDPKAEPYHWRRGIAQYYAGHYKAGVRQFESHRSVNSDDVENAVWHLLCNAKVVGLKAARAAILPVGPDRRVPMLTIYEMFAGRKTAADVLREAASASAGAQSESALFYAHLYIGLHHLARDESAAARRHIKIAAEKHTSSHYMGDLARMHVAHVHLP